MCGSFQSLWTLSAVAPLFYTLLNSLFLTYSLPGTQSCLSSSNSRRRCVRPVCATLASILRPRRTCAVRRGSWTCWRVDRAWPRPDADARACAMGTQWPSLHPGGHLCRVRPSSARHSQLLFIASTTHWREGFLYMDTAHTKRPVQCSLQDAFGQSRCPAILCEK